MSATNNPCDLLLDTHVWVRYINGTPGLRPETVTAIETARRSGDIFVSVISIWEVALLVKKKRLNLPMPVERWVEQAMRLPGVQLLPLTPEIAMQSVQLPDSLNRDPADRILVASALVARHPLMTRDKDIIRFAKQTHLSIVRA